MAQNPGFLARVFRPTLYIRLSPTRVNLHLCGSDVHVEEVPEMAVQQPPGGKLTLLAVGQQARSAAAQASDARLINPLAHPRSLISDFTLAEQLLRALVRQVMGRGLFQPAPAVVMHPLGEYEGGLTQVEIRALRELALGMGASTVRVWQGPDLSDEQIRSGQSPASGRWLD